MLEKELAALKEKGKKPFILRKLFYFFLRPRSTEAILTRYDYTQY